MSPSTVPSAAPSGIPSIQTDPPSAFPTIVNSASPTPIGKDMLSSSPTIVNVECKLCSAELCVVKRKGRMASPRIGEESCVEVLMRLREGDLISPDECDELQVQFEANCLLMGDVTAITPSPSFTVSLFPSDSPSSAPATSEPSVSR
jgi:hypothetical protein